MWRYWTLQVCVLAVMLGILASPAAPQPQQEIVFVSILGGNADVYRMHGNGAAQTNLTRHAAEDTSPCWSPDGSRIAFVSARDGNLEIYTMRADGSGLARQTYSPDADTEPAWSPDGRQLLFLRKRQGRTGLWILNVDHGHDACLTQGPYEDMQPEWSPNGEYILLVRVDNGGVPQLWKIPTGGPEPLRQLTRDAKGASYGRWSPDGKWIVYASARSGDIEIWKMRADGTSPTQLTRAPGRDRDPRWSPNGNAIAFVSTRDGNDEVYRMGPGGEKQTNLTRSPGLDLNPRWSDDSAHLLFDSSRGGGGIFAMTSSDGKRVWQLTKGTVSAKGRFGPRLAATPPPVTPAPVTTRRAWPEAIVYMALRPGRPEEVNGELRLMNPNGSNGRAVPNVGLVTSPAISYDRGWIAHIRYDPAAPLQSTLWRCRPDGTDMQSITPPALGRRYYRHLEWFPGGTQLLVGHMPAAIADWGGGAMYGVVQIPSLTWRPLGVVGLAISLAPDGQRLAVIRNGQKQPNEHFVPSHLWVTDLEGRNIRQLTSERYALDQGPGWSPDGQRVAFLRRHLVQGTFNMLPTSDLLIVSAAGGLPSVVVADRLRPFSESRVVWSPDGSQLLVGSSHEGKHRLYAVTIATRLLTPLTGAQESAESHHWR